MKGYKPQKKGPMISPANEPPFIGSGGEAKDFQEFKTLATLLLLEVISDVYAGHLPISKQGQEHISRDILLEELEKALNFERHNLEALKIRLVSLLEPNNKSYALPWLESFFDALSSQNYGSKASQSLKETLNIFRRLSERNYTTSGNWITDPNETKLPLGYTDSNPLLGLMQNPLEIEKLISCQSLHQIIKTLAGVHVEAYKSIDTVSEKSETQYLRLKLDSYQDGLRQLQEAIKAKQEAKSNNENSPKQSYKTIGELAMRTAVKALTESKLLTDYEQPLEMDFLLFSYARQGGINNWLKNIHFAPYSRSHYVRNRECVLRLAERVQIKSVVTIIGVGLGQDIPLNELAQQFNKINLVDMDAFSMILAWLQLPTQEVRDKVHFHVLDITGGKAGQFLEQAYKIIETNSTPSSAVEQIEKLCGNGDDSFNFSLSDKFPILSSSYVISSMTASQLLWPVQHLIQRRLRQKFDVSAPILRLNRTKMVEAHLNLLFHWSEPGGRAYYSDNPELKSFTHDRPVNQIAFYDEKQVDNKVRELFTIEGQFEWLWWINAPDNFDHYLVRAYHLKAEV